MNIGLDFDKTYTIDPPFWDSFIQLAFDHGHSVYCVTSRIDTARNRSQVVINNVETVFCGFASKASYMREFRDVAIDVWVDDDPAMCAFGKHDPRPLTITRPQTQRLGFVKRQHK